MRSSACIAIFLILVVFFLVSCQVEETPPPSPTSPPTRTLIPSATLPSSTPTDTPYPSETPSPRPPTNTLSATLTQTWPQTPTLTPTITRTPTKTPTSQPTLTATGTPPTGTPTPTVTNTPAGSPTATGSPTPSASPTTPVNPLLWINPSNLTTSRVGQTAPVIVTLSSVSNVFAIDLTINFNPSILTVIDSNTTMVGIQIRSGDCPQADSVVRNMVNLQQGEIYYIVTQLSRTPPCSGGPVAYITFECIAPGTTELSFENTMIANNVGSSIVHDTQSGSITCQP